MSILNYYIQYNSKQNICKIALTYALRSSVLRQISSNGHRPLPPECHGLVDQIS